MKDRPTRDRLLEAALAVFAERGYERATLAEITRRAGANIAAVNYYFRSKSDLFCELIETYFGPVNRARTEVVNDCAARLGDSDEPLAELVAAIVDPLVELGAEREEGRSLMRLMLQMRGMPLGELYPILVRAFDPVHEAVVDALAIALPQMTRPELVWRYDMARGAILHILSDTRQIERRVGSAIPAEDFLEIEKRMMRSFVLGAFSTEPVLTR